MLFNVSDLRKKSVAFDLHFSKREKIVATQKQRPIFVSAGIFNRTRDRLTDRFTKVHAASCGTNTEYLSDVSVRRIRIFILNHNLFVIAQVANGAHWFLNGSRHEIKHTRIVSRHSRIFINSLVHRSDWKGERWEMCNPCWTFRKARSRPESMGSIAFGMSSK